MGENYDEKISIKSNTSLIFDNNKFYRCYCKRRHHSTDIRFKHLEC